jgi:hypothetical protein
MAPRSKALAGEDGTSVALVGPGPMQGHRQITGCRVAARVTTPTETPCLLLEASFMGL